ncbi:MAG: hypothetical protein HC924_03660 [Synechococcaceae cyanobacterium SM2_3_2]|nr:hypothetical protein [Synechococcaceae cyanobacterium SM2_3_2]
MTEPITLLLGGADPSPAAQVAEQGFRHFLSQYSGQAMLDYPGPTWDGYGIHRWLWGQGIPVSTPLSLISFSAGVAGAALLATLRPDSITSIIAVDGWCVPLKVSNCKVSNCTVYRLSHDWLTHANGLLFGGDYFFYADPHVSHLDLWRDPAGVEGWEVGQLGSDQEPVRTHAATFLLAAGFPDHKTSPSPLD